MTALFMGLPAHLFKRADGKPVIVEKARSPVPKLEEVKEIASVSVMAHQHEPKIVSLPANPSLAPNGGAKEFGHSEAHPRSGAASERFFQARAFWPDIWPYCGEDFTD